MFAIRRPERGSRAIGHAGQTPRLPTGNRDKKDLWLSLVPRRDKGKPRAIGRPARLHILALAAGQLLALSMLQRGQPDRRVGLIFRLVIAAHNIGNLPAVGRGLWIIYYLEPPEILQGQRAFFFRHHILL